MEQTGEDRGRSAKDGLDSEQSYIFLPAGDDDGREQPGDGKAGDVRDPCCRPRLTIRAEAVREEVVAAAKSCGACYSAFGRACRCGSIDSTSRTSTHIEIAA